MKIVVVGPGAMGCLFAGLLVEAGQPDVWLLDKDEARARSISENGLKIEGIGGNRTISKISATAEPKIIEIADLVLIFVKSYDTEGASHSILPIVGEKTAVLTLQNGLNNLETISRVLGKEKVLAGITSHGATMLDVGHIRHAGSGETIIGEPQGEISARAENIAKILSSAGIKTSVSPDINSFIWAKLIINAAINPITALTKLKNGELLEHKETRRLLAMVASESMDIATACNITIPYKDPVLMVESVCKATSNNISSMLQDVLRKKRTEIDAINGAIVNEAKKIKIDAPINETLLKLVRVISEQ